ncbi:xanthine dehydrogenase family protein molybdopterin-binding subunit [Pseudorhodoplanes sp.]|uniref:xanthine dehydrogenase family protein molybdopterin-binding subunit n=1 Tax=Pseudorhodoplanes sp. TaxID=1934341 RepID=UPI002C84C1C6|nr:xanthine dehydrogenase family protein molybdopterin-binding subunit [Pseudorhodoplanes sp.]HWV42930.1 xanthine dehydrogenase family protein molybdopterin-binding subunit [Pseudorhodoplanes sp.]
MAADSDHPSHGPRVEDDALVRGRGHFVDDVEKQGVAHAVFVRSPHAHARIVGISLDEALKAPGVLGVLTAADLEGIGSVTRHPPIGGRGGAKIAFSHRPCLADGKVMHVGEAVAMVVADSLPQALDAAELVAVEYEELPALVDAREALKSEAPRLFDDIPGNLALDYPGPVDDPANVAAVDEIIRSAAHVARVTVVQQRMVMAPMETRGGTGSFDARSGRYTLRVCSQGAGPMRDMVAAIMGIDKQMLRVVTEDVGGAFGLKSGAYPEYPVLLAAAKKYGRKVHWMASRSEAFNSDNQGRDNVTIGELALDADGKFLALRARQIQNLGAYVASAGIQLATNNFARCFPAMYDIPKIDIGVQCVYTNTIPTGPYRGAGRPEANYLIERLVDEAARVTGIDRIALRKRNLIPPSAIPYKTAMGATFDSGAFPEIFDKALALAQIERFADRRRESEANGKLRGIGISCFLEHSGGVPNEGAWLTFPGNGTVVVNMNVGNTGQGHATIYPRLVADKLAIDPALVKHRQGDSDLEIKGWPSVASRSTITAGTAVVRTVEAMLEKGKMLAAQILEADEKDIAYRRGQFEVVGTDRAIGLFDLAVKAAEMKDKGEIAESLDTRRDVDTPQTFPNGCHIAEVEIEPETGEVAVVGYYAVDDCGTVLDHTLAHGQVHGGIAQGLGQVLLEHAVYDAANGQLVTGSFMDYAMPRANNMPSLLRDDSHPVPATTNPLGVKGVGEAGTTASLAAIMNAIADALPAAAQMDMPATMEKIWRVCQAANVQTGLPAREASD